MPFFFFFYCALMAQKLWWTRLLMPQHKSGQWHQTVLMVIVFFTTTQLWRKDSVSVKNVLGETVNSINLIKSPRVHVFLLFCVTKWETHRKHLLPSKDNHCLGKSTHMTELWAISPTFYMEHHFYSKEYLRDKPRLFIFECLAHVLLKIDKNEPATSRKTTV